MEVHSGDDQHYTQQTGHDSIQKRRHLALSLPVRLRLFPSNNRLTKSYFIGDISDRDDHLPHLLPELRRDHSHDHEDVIRQLHLLRFHQYDHDRTWRRYA